MGVAVRRYYTSPRTHDDYLESWLELWDGPPGADDAKLLPGYGWIFGMGDGSVNVGLGVLNSSRRLPEDQLPAAAHPLAGQHPRGMGPARGERAGCDPGCRVCRWASTARRTTPTVCCWWGTPAARSIPFNGEGIPYAMESGKFAAEAVVQALARPEGPCRELALQGYPTAMAAEWGAYYRLGGRVREADRQPGGDACLHAARPAPPAPDEVRAQAAGEPVPIRTMATPATGSSRR